MKILIMKLRILGALVAALTTLGPLAAHALPVADEDRVNIDFRRTTLVVRDIIASLKLYRDVLGMRVIYDQMIRTPTDKPDDETDRIRRLVFLQANDTYIGVIGLLEYQKPVKTQPLSRLAFEPGTSVQLFATTDLEAKFEAAKQVPGVVGISPPRVVNYPNYDGSGTIPVKVSIVSDPDGFILEINEPLVDLNIAHE